MLVGKKKDGGHASIPLTSDGAAVITELASDSITTKLIETSAVAGSSPLSSLTWTGGALTGLQSLYVEADGSNSGTVSIGAIGGTGGVKLAAGESAEVTGSLDPTLTEIRVGVGDTASLTAQVPST